MTSPIRSLPDELSRMLFEMLEIKEQIALASTNREMTRFLPVCYDQTQCLTKTYVYRNFSSGLSQFSQRYLLYSRIHRHPYGWHPLYSSSYHTKRELANRPVIEILLYNRFRRNEYYHIKLYRPYFHDKTIKDYLVEYSPITDVVTRRRTLIA